MNPLTRISFEVPGEPVAKERPRTNMATGVVYTPAKTKNYEETVKWCYQMAAHGARFPDNEPLSMLVVAYRPIPKSESAKKKSLMRAGAERPITKPDWDNVGKIVSDALNGIAYRDDSQIVDARVVKRYSDNPMVKVSVWLTSCASFRLRRPKRSITANCGRTTSSDRLQRGTGQVTTNGCPDFLQLRNAPWRCGFSL